MPERENNSRILKSKAKQKKKAQPNLDTLRTRRPLFLTRSLIIQ